MCGRYGSLRRMRADLGGDQRACALSRCEVVRAGGGGAGPLQHRYSGPAGADRARPPPGAERQRRRHAPAVDGEPFLGEPSLQAASLGSNPAALGRLTHPACAEPGSAAWSLSPGLGLPPKPRRDAAYCHRRSRHSWERRTRVTRDQPEPFPGPSSRGLAETRWLTHSELTDSELAVAQDRCLYDPDTGGDAGARDGGGGGGGGPASSSGPSLPEAGDKGRHGLPPDLRWSQRPSHAGAGCVVTSPVQTTATAGAQHAAVGEAGPAHGHHPPSFPGPAATGPSHSPRRVWAK